MPRTKRSTRAAIILGTLLWLGGCGTHAHNLPPIPPADAGDYRLGPADQVRIITFGEEQLTGEFRVSDSGSIALPLLGGIRTTGLSPTQLEGVVATAMRKANLFKDPKVSVEVIAYRPMFILGEVARPGQYPYQPGMTVVTAAAVAGGFTYRAAQDEASIIRTVRGEAVEGRADRQTYVQPGDVITIYERHL